MLNLLGNARHSSQMELQNEHSLVYFNVYCEQKKDFLQKLSRILRRKIKLLSENISSAFSYNYVTARKNNFSDRSNNFPLFCEE